MGEIIKVGIADLKVGESGDILITVGLGSCVGVCCYDPVAKIGGLSHIMLPESSLAGSPPLKPTKYADTAIPMLVDQMEEKGGVRRRFEVKIAGGARMFRTLSDNGTINIGERNVKAVKEVLNALELKLVGEDTGKNYGRTVELHTDTGRVIVKTAGMGSYEI
ncbi:MAG TPA: chemotaxis protein CheD [Candidatus Syntrophoarchaeum butanivorans]|uniref:Probable chemoreceptor glutamine deamidase CheD n=1 Tax=Candidatus Syntropharchaeum butanivorans TaxID=1839936 RepID=A0A1F2P3R9_9EURY|nr:MAG: chemotaxis protein CheD [Candidatus Syntrophoarchaeum butanivorans]RJS70546.1 MAG: chemotaxis protein CheD [Candidatus Syntrophoarchaeum sp. WYZ-LMO15]HDM36024.1 chemotaxis protein CheD [Candidatus Syntrophoarchaeum butanivorans]HEC56536.1 chemotaxis protein CheD [Candidatus Syntrophoarchaeum butanivorans]